MYVNPVSVLSVHYRSTLYYNFNNVIYIHFSLCMCVFVCVVVCVVVWDIVCVYIHVRISCTEFFLVCVDSVLQNNTVSYILLL